MQLALGVLEALANSNYYHQELLDAVAKRGFTLLQDPVTAAKFDINMTSWGMISYARLNAGMSPLHGRYLQALADRACVVMADATQQVRPWGGCKAKLNRKSSFRPT